MKVCVGLFGTCGGSRWRDAFIERYEAAGMKDGVDFFNPQVEDWDPSMAEIEAEHLAEDAVICFPITSETYSLGSLAEVGFSALNASGLDSRRDFIVMIEQGLDPSLMEDETLAKESTRGRALVLQHLKKLRFANIFVVTTLAEMLEVSLACYNKAKMMEPMMRRFNPHSEG